MTLIHHDLSVDVVKAMTKVHSVLGPGLLESAYEGDLSIELRKREISFVRQLEVPLFYEGEFAGRYFADLVIEGRIVLELKSVTRLAPIMEAQLINYLRLTECRVGYLVNFNSRVLERKRLVL